jgi:hypothetical protein
MAIRYRKSGGSVGGPRLWLVSLVVLAVLAAPFVGATMDDGATDITGQESAGSGEPSDLASTGASGASAMTDDGSAPAATTVEDAESGSSETVTVNTTTDGEDIAGDHANLSWDPSVLQFESVSGVDFAGPVGNVDSDDDWLFATQSRANGTVAVAGTTAPVADEDHDNATTADVSMAESGTVAVAAGASPAPATTAADPAQPREPGTQAPSSGGDEPRASLLAIFGTAALMLVCLAVASRFVRE